MVEPLLSIRELVKHFGGVTATNRVSLDVVPQQTHALIGPNGAGKTTLISLLQGEKHADSGSIYFAGADITARPAHKRAQLGLSRSFQITSAIAMKPRLLLLDEPMAGMGRQDGLRMTGILRDLKRSFTILLVEHDMTAVFALADQVSVLVSGEIIATGSPDEIRCDPKVRAAYLGNCG